MESEQIPLFFEDVYDALRYLVQASGGAKVVGCQIFSSKEPEQAGRALMDCLNANRAEKLDPEQLIALLRIGHERGCHGAVEYICSRSGYSRPDPIVTQNEQAELIRTFNKKVDDLLAAAMQIKAARGA